MFLLIEIPRLLDVTCPDNEMIEDIALEPTYLMCVSVSAVLHVPTGDCSNVGLSAVRSRSMEELLL